MSTRAVEVPDDVGPGNGLTPRPSRGRRRIRFPMALTPRSAGGLYVLGALIVLFSIWQSATFPEYVTVTSILSDNTVSGLIALGLILPLAAGEYDLSVGYVTGLSSMIFASLLAHPSISPLEAALITVAACAGVGLVNGLLVVGVGLNSFIATLATGSLIEALIQTLSGGLTLSAGVIRVAGFATDNVQKITIPIVSLFALVVLLWVFMQHTATGRKLYATGMGRESSRMAGIRTSRLRYSSLIFSASVAGFAGIVVTAQIGAASPDLGPPYLIPAFAAAYLGATQFTPGLFNSWGTLLAIILLGTVNEGLALANVPSWVPYLSTGSVLIIALAIGQLREREVSFSRLLRRPLTEPFPTADTPASE